MDVTLRLNLDQIAGEVNEAAAEDVETPEAVKTWVEQNDSTMRILLTDAVIETIAEAYE